MDQRLTDKDTVTDISGADLMEVVVPSDTTANPAGTTKKATVNAIKNTIIGATTTGNAILSGGIIHISGLTYYVWADSYIINSQVYNIAVNSTVTLSDGDATNPRIDVFLIRIQTTNLPITASVVVLEGTPAASPVKPTVDLTDEVEVSFRTIAATETTDPTTVTELIYDENTGEPNEWDNTTNVTGGNLADTTDPYTGTISFTAPATTNDDVSWTKATVLGFDVGARLNFALRIPGGINSGSGIPRIQIKLINSSTSEYWLLTLSAGNLNKYGFSTANLNWQLVQIPFNAFAPSSISGGEYDRIEFTLLDMPIMELDWINIQSDITQPVDPVSPERLTFRREFTAAEIRLLNSVPIEVVKPPGVGLAIVQESMQMKWTHVTVPYSATTISSIVDTALISQFGPIGISTTAFQFLKVPTTALTGNTQMVENKGLLIQASADTAAGDGTFILTGAYYLIET